MILVGLCVAIPVFGARSIVFLPLQHGVMTRVIELPGQSWYSHDWSGLVSWTEYNVTIALTKALSQLYVDDVPLSSPLSMNVTSGNSALACSTTSSAALPFVIIATYVVVSANFNSTNGILYVKSGQGDPSDVMAFAETIPLRYGSHLSALLSTTQRQIFSKNSIDFIGLTTPTRMLTMNEALLVQADLFPPNSGSDTVSLRLRLRGDTRDPAKLVQDYTEQSALTGVATFGGLWTFVNGTFAMFFGANILYFLFSKYKSHTQPGAIDNMRRKKTTFCSGLVHIFQRRSLVQKWHEDFPALHTEGGRPGSESAGIVAFIRERLVDLDDKEDHESPLTPVGDLEDQNMPSDAVTARWHVGRAQMHMEMIRTKFWKMGRVGGLVALCRIVYGGRLPALLQLRSRILMHHGWTSYL
ncbi:hypothetical protein B0H10DRAFT_2199224 [Mycena sp. CBHHK59/15]|nr:hypothetical protein B0H10DRAFT_2199224 [Mycena sp. CBHHK59/15]